MESERVALLLDNDLFFVAKIARDAQATLATRRAQLARWTPSRKRLARRSQTVALVNTRRVGSTGARRSRRRARRVSPSSRSARTWMSRRSRGAQRRARRASSPTRSWRATCRASSSGRCRLARGARRRRDGDEQDHAGPTEVRYGGNFQGGKRRHDRDAIGEQRSDACQGGQASRNQWHELAQQLRVDSIRCTTAAGSGHPTSSMSARRPDGRAAGRRYLRYDFANPKTPTTTT